MQDKHIYEYAIIRVVPRVERGEFMNVGVIVFCKTLSFLEMRYLIHEERLKLLHNDIDIPDIQCHLESYQKICKGEESGGPIARLDLPSRFRWLTAKRSTIIQSSEVHPGLCSDPQETLEKLFSELVSS
ncbi:MAG TPA: DUF3037 domain-containing protein [Chitinophagaceae bacterium]|nr:DUF3037 domain-containing protein [Chitinophagaceae bacterium]